MKASKDDPHVRVFLMNSKILAEIALGVRSNYIVFQYELHEALGLPPPQKDFTDWWTIFQGVLNLATEIVKAKQEIAKLEKELESYRSQDTYVELSNHLHSKQAATI